MRSMASRVAADAFMVFCWILRRGFERQFGGENYIGGDESDDKDQKNHRPDPDGDKCAWIAAIIDGIEAGVAEDAEENHGSAAGSAEDFSQRVAEGGFDGGESCGCFGIEKDRTNRRRQGKGRRCQLRRPSCLRLRRG